MKSHQGSDNIDLFDHTDRDVETTIQNRYWGPNSTIIKMIEFVDSLYHL